MTENKYIDLLKKIKEAKQNNIPLIFKQFLNDDETPKWQEILDCIYDQYNEGKKVITEYDSYLSIIPDNLLQDKYFLQLSNLKNTLKLQCHGPKVSIGPFNIGSHKDNWDAIAVQCEGNNTWTISDKPLTENPLYVESFDLQRGDLLFCPQGIYHSIKSNNARASIIYVGNL